MARSTLKVTVDSGDFYLKLLTPGVWGVFNAPEDENPQFTVNAPDDATTVALEGEIDFYLLDNEPDTVDDDEFDPEDQYSYNDRW